jgi:allantoinase
MIVKHGQVALPGQEKTQAVDIRVEDGRIVEIGSALAGGEAVDASGMLVLPGGIDPHVHFDDPGYTHREDFYHGTCASASGGITTVIDMPFTSLPPVTDADNLAQKLDAVDSKAVVDFGFYGGVSAQSWEADGAAAMAGLADKVLGFKTYFVSGMESVGRLDHYRFGQVLAQARALSLPVLLHAEDYDYVTAGTGPAMAGGAGPGDFYRSRPEAAEILAVLAAAELAREQGADLHIVHVGTADAAQFLAERDVTCETAPHYLAFDLDDFQRIGAPLKVTPPVKSAGHRECLWELLAKGAIDFVASDHAPCPASEKATGSIWTAYSGIPGSGTLLPYMVSEGYLAGRLSLSRLLEVIAEGAARRYGLDDRKGAIAVGRDGDLVLIDPQQQWTVRGHESYSQGKITPFEGMTLRGRVVATIVRGELVYQADAGICVAPGHGRWLRRARANLGEN